MSGPSLDLEKPNAIGGLDRLVTSFALSIIAVIPTFFTCITRPWRLKPLLEGDDPDGRIGTLLAPGAYFPLALILSFTLAAILATPETLAYNGSFIGPDLAVSVQSAAAEGNVWKIISTIMPIYGMAVFLGLLGTCLKPWAGESWSLRVSLRAAFYVIGTLTSWLILTTAVIDLIRLSTGSNDIPSLLYSLIIFPTVGALIWMYAGFHYDQETVSRRRSGVLGAATFGLLMAVIFAMDVLMRL